MTGLLVAMAILTGCGPTAGWKPAPADPIYDHSQFAVFEIFDARDHTKYGEPFTFVIEADAVDELGNPAKMAWVDGGGAARPYPRSDDAHAQGTFEVRYVGGWKVNIHATATFKGEVGESVSCGFKDLYGNKGGRAEARHYVVAADILVGDNEVAVTADCKTVVV
jgi:hypothetical protein